MDSGACLINSNFISCSEAEEIYQKIRDTDWIPTIPDGSYSNDAWRVIKLISNGKPTQILNFYPEISKIIARFKCNIIHVVLYSILPGGVLHPHRDVSGTLELGRLRFHIPLITNPKVEFRVSHKLIPMRIGELWALNTSYLHAVANHGDHDRVHLVFEVEANDWCWSLLPKKGFKYYLHFVVFFILIGLRAVKTIFFEPTKLKGRIGLLFDLLKLVKRKLLMRRQ